MWRDLGESLDLAAAFAFIGYLLPLMAAMLVFGWTDHALYTRLSGRTMAMPDWEPWWGWYLLHGSAGAVGLVAGIVAGWRRWSRRTR